MRGTRRFKAPAPVKVELNTGRAVDTEVAKLAVVTFIIEWVVIELGTDKLDVVVLSAAVATVIGMVVITTMVEVSFVWTVTVAVVLTPVGRTADVPVLELARGAEAAGLIVVVTITVVVLDVPVLVLAAEGATTGATVVKAVLVDVLDVLMVALTPGPETRGVTVVKTVAVDMVVVLFGKGGAATGVTVVNNVDVDVLL